MDNLDTEQDECCLVDIDLKENIDDECSICLECMPLKDENHILSCGHMFHRRCIALYIIHDEIIDKKCPLCRTNIDVKTIPLKIHERLNMYSVHIKRFSAATMYTLAVYAFFTLCSKITNTTSGVHTNTTANQYADIYTQPCDPAPI